MKKTIAILLLFIYTVSAFGIAVNYHYCDGYLSGVKVLNFGGKGDCKCDATGIPKDCCKDKLLYIKGDDHKSSQGSYISTLATYLIDIPVYETIYSFQKASYQHLPINFCLVSHKSLRHLFLLNNAFRI